MLEARLGIAPIAWWNDDPEELSDDVSLDECLRQAAEAGLSGMETELDLLMKHSSVPLLFDAGHMTFAGGDNFRVIDDHHARISHVHAKDVRQAVIDGLDRGRESFLDAVVEGAFTVPGDGSLDFEAIAKALAAKGYEGWFVIEAEQDPRANPPLEMARKGRAELYRVLDAAGYEVVA